MPRKEYCSERFVHARSPKCRQEIPLRCTGLVETKSDGDRGYANILIRIAAYEKSERFGE